MDRNPYSYAPAADHDAATSPRSRTLTISQFVHVVVMFCQFSFWIWILYDQQTQWKNSTPLLVFFSTMVTLFGIGVVCDTLCLCRLLCNSDTNICTISLVVCLALAVFMLGAHSSLLILGWLIFSAIWAAACITRLKAVSSHQSANNNAVNRSTHSHGN